MNAQRPTLCVAIGTLIKGIGLLLFTERTKGRGSSVDIVTCYGLDGPGDRIPMGARFSASIQTGPGARPASYTIGAGSLPGVKLLVRGVDHPPPSSAEVKERVELYLYATSEPSWPVIG